MGGIRWIRWIHPSRFTRDGHKFFPPLFLQSLREGNVGLLALAPTSFDDVCAALVKYFTGVDNYPALAHLQKGARDDLDFDLVDDPKEEEEGEEEKEKEEEVDQDDYFTEKGKSIMDEEDEEEDEVDESKLVEILGPTEWLTKELEQLKAIQNENEEEDAALDPENNEEKMKQISVRAKKMELVILEVEAEAKRELRELAEENVDAHEVEARAKMKEIGAGNLGDAEVEKMASEQAVNLMMNYEDGLTLEQALKAKRKEIEEEDAALDPENIKEKMKQISVRAEKMQKEEAERAERSVDLDGGGGSNLNISSISSTSMNMIKVRGGNDEDEAKSKLEELRRYVF
ncbi:hypothetical protein TrVE_jg8345 [Triparma verrucosa]|uniref:Uncharacterized protein n=1 Tax=Triparma verrucosa TaxID=1606542 RepID=A0A9W7BWK1_9STRA|nr:hypothetical protein TrVE_jg8345 [Triparma verrucosa]